MMMVGGHLVNGVEMEMVGAVMEITDVAWSALEHHQHQSRGGGGGGGAEEDALSKDDRVALESALAHERQENERLRAALHQYEAALTRLQANQSASSSSPLLSPLACPDNFSERLREKLHSTDYIERLQLFHQNGGDDINDTFELKVKEESLVDIGIEDPSWWVWVTEDELSFSQPKIEPGGLDAEGYVVVTEEDIIDGIANFLAQYIILMPEAKKMSCKELHEAITKAFTKIDRMGKLKKLWAMGKVLYSLASLGTSIYWIYRNPVILRGAVMAVRTSAKLVVKALA